jgi:hypothetical protein
VNAAVYKLAERYPRALHAFRVCGDAVDDL